MSQKRRAEVIDEFQNSPGGGRGIKEDDDDDLSATEQSDEGEEDDGGTEYGSDDDDFVPAEDGKKRKGVATRKPAKKRSRSAATKTSKSKGKGKARAGTQMRLGGDGPAVMLISLQAGSQGLNLTAAQVWLTVFAMMFVS